MTESDNKQHDGYPGQVGLDKRADILQATFEHYFKMAMDHLTKATTTSNILLIIVGVIIGLVGLDNKVGGGVDLVGGFGVFVIGIFGAVWALKQHERYHFWQHIAYEYQKELTKIVPMLKTGEDYYAGAGDAAVKEFGSLFARRIQNPYLWVSLHGIVAVTGLGLMAVSI
jgi:hypothetical protein